MVTLKLSHKFGKKQIWSSTEALWVSETLNKAISRWLHLPKIYVYLPDTIYNLVDSFNEDIIEKQQWNQFMIDPVEIPKALLNCNSSV